MPEEIRSAIGALTDSYFPLVSKPIFAVWRTDNGPRGKNFQDHALHIYLTPEGAMFEEKILGTESRLKDTSFIQSLEDYESVKDSVEVFWSYDVEVMRRVMVLERERFRNERCGNIEF